MKRTAERYTKGQSLVIVAFAILVLIGFVGLAVDLGLSYMERIRARRAADAAALSAATELPLEAAAQIRALEFLDENNYGCELEVDAAAAGYRCGETTTVRLEINHSYVSGPATEEAERVIIINTSDYRDPPTLADSANRIRVEVVEKAPIYFMKVFGFSDMPISASAIAENINNLDVALVFDMSSSMEFDSLCRGCWVPDGDPYPSGHLNPLNWDGDLNGDPDHCEGSSPLQHDGNQYIIIEAEEYSYKTPSHNRSLYQPGQTYWVIQRNGGHNAGNYGVPSYMRNGGGAGSLGRDDLGGYIAHLPPRSAIGADGMGIPCDVDVVRNEGLCSYAPRVLEFGGPYSAPRVDYKFSAPTSGRWYIWFRGQGGDGNGAPRDGKHFIWGIDGTPATDYAKSVHRTNFGDIAHSNKWSWQRAGYYDISMGGEEHTVNFWGGDPGIALDRIVITTDSRNPTTFFDKNNDNDGEPYSSYQHLVNNILNGPATSVADN
ncbi:MAG: pilus assembly protein TadG-related protein, partial [Anaerolineales bacterium]